MTIAPGLLNRGDQRIGVPVGFSPTGVDPDKMRYRGIRSLANVALVIEFGPEFFPGAVRLVGPFQGEEGLSRIVRNTVAAEKARPFGIVEIHLLFQYERATLAT